jgi:hypothetical protein
MSDRLLPFCLAYFFAIEITESSIVRVSFVVIIRVNVSTNIRVKIKTTKCLDVRMALAGNLWLSATNPLTNAYKRIKMPFANQR